MAVNELEAGVRHASNIAIIDLHGTLNALSDPTMSGAYAEAAKKDPATVLLNFSDVEYINSSGIAVIVAVLGKVRQDGRKLRAWGLTDHYRKIFEITHLADFIEVFADESSAVSAAS
jgi:anti-sigma B factor antagonist